LPKSIGKSFGVNTKPNGNLLMVALQEYMPTTKNLSRNTITSYRDAIRQLLEYIVSRGKSLDTLNIEDISDTLVTDFYSILKQISLFCKNKKSTPRCNT